MAAPEHRMICAWLGALAMILDGAPESRWRGFTAHLENDGTVLGRHAWSVIEIERYLRLLATDLGDPDLVVRLHAVHQLFLAHFSAGGPALR